MDHLSVFTCKNCGADLNINDAVGGVLTCKYCRSILTLPRGATSSAALALLRSGEHNLDTRHFDDAYTMFRKAAEEDPAEPEAWFGMALAKAQVQYLKDYRANGKEVATDCDFRMQPICYEISERKFTEDENYKKAVERATPQQKIAYREKAEEIDKIRAEFSELKKSGLSYDCFICVKVSSEDGKGHTEDVFDATKIYHSLKDAGYRPFFSEEEMKDRAGARYEALILYALYSSECMLVICSNEDYLQTPWVKNEYTRYMKMLVEESKQRESITIAFKGTPIEKLPGLQGKIQGIDRNSFDGLQRILNFVDRFASSKNEIPEIKRKDYSGTSYKKKQVNRAGVAKRELTTIGGGELTVSDRSKLNIATEFMTRKDFPNALRFLDNMLRENAGNGEAHFLRFLAENNCATEQEFEKNDFRVHGFDSLEKAIAATQDSARRKKFYELLYGYTAKTKDLAAYQEYVVLPESTERKIADLTDIMYHLALETLDGKIFDEVIKTITDADQYIELNLQFAHTLRNPSQNMPSAIKNMGDYIEMAYEVPYATVKPSKDVLKYYTNILNVDEGHGEALWEVFAAAHGGSGGALLAYCSGEGLSGLEEKLFAYGYNAYAAKKILGLCTQYAVDKTEEVCRLFDFLLAMTPKKQETAFCNSICQMVGRFLRGKKFDAAKKYNELLLSSDPLAHEGYFNRVLIKNRFGNPLEIIDLEGKLLDDTDYFSAINSYAERFSNKANFYLDINEMVNTLNAHLRDPECRNYLKVNVYVPVDKIPTCLQSLLNALNQEAERCFNVVLARYHCKDSEDMLKLTQDITKDDDFIRAAKFAECADMERGIIVKTYREQKKASEKNKKNATKRKKFVDRSIGAVILVVAAIGFWLTTLIGSFTGERFVTPFAVSLFNGNLMAVYCVIPICIVAPFIAFGITIIVLTVRDKRVVPSIFTALIYAVSIIVGAVGINNVYRGQEMVYYGDGYTLCLKKEDDEAMVDLCQVSCTVQDIKIPSFVHGYPVTSIGNVAFAEIKNITIPFSVNTIGHYAFEGSGLESITVDEENKNFSSQGGILYNKAKTMIVRVPWAIKGTVIPDSITTIGYEEFWGRRQLTEITIPNSVTSIGSSAFSGCTALKNIHFTGTMQEWNAISKYISKYSSYSEIYESENWNYHTGDYTVTCTDGVLDKDGNVIT